MDKQMPFHPIFIRVGRLNTSKHKVRHYVDQHSIEHWVIQIAKLVLHSHYIMKAATDNI
jgi:hypothetical protein